MLYESEERKREEERSSKAEGRRGRLMRVIEAGLVSVWLPVCAAEADLACGPLVKQQCSGWVGDTENRGSEQRNERYTQRDYHLEPKY